MAELAMLADMENGRCCLNTGDLSKHRNINNNLIYLLIIYVDGQVETAWAKYTEGCFVHFSSIKVLNHTRTNRLCS